MTSLVDAFETERITVHRFAAGKYVRGFYERGEESVLEMAASIQTLSPAEIRQLPEHRRNAEAVRIYTEGRLRTTDEKGGTPADVVEHAGRKFEIHRVEDWSQTDLPHFKSIGVLMDGEGVGDGNSDC